MLSEIIQCLLNHPDGLTIKETANILGLTTSNADGVFYKLRKKGVVVGIGRKYDSLTKKILTVYKISSEYYFDEKTNTLTYKQDDYSDIFAISENYRKEKD